MGKGMLGVASLTAMFKSMERRRQQRGGFKFQPPSQRVRRFNSGPYRQEQADARRRRQIAKGMLSSENGLIEG